MFGHKLIKVKFNKEVVVLCEEDETIENIFHMAYDGLYEDVLNSLPEMHKTVIVREINSNKDLPKSYHRTSLPWGADEDNPENLTIEQILKGETR